jgi:hypothetical protein
MATSAAAPFRGLTGLHLLLTYECNFECDHCFVWGGPDRNGTMSFATVEHILGEAKQVGTVEWIYFEGGEPFLHYRLLCDGARLAQRQGFKVGMVSNGYWGTSDQEAAEWLRPFVGIVEDLSISDDGYHGDGGAERPALIAYRAAQRLGIPVDFISVAEPAAADVGGVAGQLPAGDSAVMFRGRAAAKLASRVPALPWRQFTRCPWEDLRQPERIHVDAFGYLHVCQGISIGNLLQRPLAEILRDYRPDEHPIVGPLLAGGPVELMNRYGLRRETGCADACHLCYCARSELRQRFPDVLVPPQMYGSN